MGKRAIIGYVVGLPVMPVLAARISKTAIPWRTRGPDDRRGQLRLVAGTARDSECSPAGEVLSCCHGCIVLQLVWPAIVNAVRQRAPVMVLRMHSVIVGMAADSESSPTSEVLSWCYGYTVLQSGWRR